MKLLLNYFLQFEPYYAIFVTAIILIPYIIHLFFKSYSYIEYFQKRNLRKNKEMQQIIKNKLLDNKMESAMQEQLLSNIFRNNFGLNVTKKERNILLDFNNNNNILWKDIELAYQFLDLKTDVLKIKPLSIGDKIDKIAIKILIMPILISIILSFILGGIEVHYMGNIYGLFYFITGAALAIMGVEIRKGNWKYKSLQRIKDILQS